MENKGELMEDYSSDESSRSLYAVHVDVEGRSRLNLPDEEPEREVHDRDLMSMPVSGSVQELTNVMPPLSGTEFQEMVIRALFQATGALMGSTSGVLHHAGEASIESAMPNTESSIPPTTWNEAAYRNAEVRRNRKPEMMRTSAGEGSDSQEDFPLPENATPEEKALRTRRLNRWRGKRAKDLTNNRKAARKLPYVIHVDGTSKPRGIHRHKWKAAVRGQCGRLDPSMDNINHHPKHVVDSIWHAMEKEWEFQGFAHKAREMFEKSATKFMRNRKMQLKYKCQKNVKALPPNDVSPSHWAKIVSITKKSMKEAASTSRLLTGQTEETTFDCDVQNSQLSLKLKDEEDDREEVFKALKRSIYEAEMSDEGPLSLATVGTGISEGGSSKMSALGRPFTRESLRPEPEDVDVQIRNLRSQLLWLQNSKTQEQGSVYDVTDVAVNLTGEKGTMSNVRRVAETMKENVVPPPSGTSHNAFFSGTSGKAPEQASKGNPGNAGKHKAASTGLRTQSDKSLQERERDLNKMEMECGDAISVAAIIEGKEQDIGKGVLMGIAGSKFARKVIPKGWCSIQLTSCSSSGGLEACPYPSGWKDPVKHKTVKDAKGHIIVWPDSLLHM